jgi:Fe-S-cluster containining protein
MNDYCTECGGKCCCMSLITVPKDDAYRREFWDTRGADKLLDFNNGTTVYASSEPCPHLTEDYKCNIYDKRPQFCRDFPRKNTPSVWKYVCKLWQADTSNKKFTKIF